MKQRWILYLTGGAAGLANGLFGGGGGMVAIPLLSRFTSLPPRQLYATCVGLIFPICALSAGIYILSGNISLGQAAPYLAGGLLGGWLGGKLYDKVSPQLLKGIFAAFLFYAGVKYLK